MSDITGVVITGKTMNCEVRQYKRIEWQPQDDITALELAKLIPLLIGMAQNPMTYWEDYISSEARRHFKIEDQ